MASHASSPGWMAESPDRKLTPSVLDLIQSGTLAHLAIHNRLDGSLTPLYLPRARVGGSTLRVSAQIMKSL